MKPLLRCTGAPWPAIGGDTVLIRVLEHVGELDDKTLLGLHDWAESDRLKMGRFRHQAAKTSWCLARWLLGSAFSDLAGDSSAIERLEAEVYGKPFIRGSSLRFNWSHSTGCVALALARDREVGVDVEACSRLRGDYLPMARSLFSPEERAWIGDNEDEGGWRRFLSVFVQKEAALKAGGMGFQASIAEAPVALVLPPAGGERWLLRTFTGGEEYYLSAAVDSGAAGGTPRFLIERTCLELDATGRAGITSMQA